MARVEIPWTVLDENSRPLSGVAVAITERSSGDPATVYAGETGGATTSLVSDALGRLNGWLAPGSYLATPAGGDAVPFEAVSGAAQNVKFRTPFNFIISGPVTAGLVMPDAQVPIVAGQEVRIVGITAKLDSGTSVICTVRVNGVEIDDGVVTAIPGGSTATPAPDHALSNLDRVDAAFSVPVGSPGDLALTVILEHTIV